MTKYILVNQGVKIAETFDEKWAYDYANARNKESDEYNAKLIESGEYGVDGHVYVYTEEHDCLSIGLFDKNNEQVRLHDIVEVSTECDAIYVEEAERFTGKVVFCCGCYGIGTNDCIPDFFYGRNDNFVTFYELYDKLNLCDYTDLSEYLTVLERGNTNDNPRNT